MLEEVSRPAGGAAGGGAEAGADASINGGRGGGFGVTGGEERTGEAGVRGSGDGEMRGVPEDV